MLEGRTAGATALDLTLIDLARKAQIDPIGLDPDDLVPLQDLVGDGALEYVLVLCSFHCITRVADLLGAEPEMPAIVRRHGVVRRSAILTAGFGLRLLGLGGGKYGTGFEEASASIQPVFESATGSALGDHLDRLKPRPQLVEALQLILEEQHHRSSLAADVLRRVHHLVEKIIRNPSIERESSSDPIDVFVDLGTRSPYRATENHVAALREYGLDDLGSLDLAIAIADSNMWARYYRLLGLAPEIYYAS